MATNKTLPSPHTSIDSITVEAYLAMSAKDRKAVRQFLDRNAADTLQYLKNRQANLKKGNVRQAAGTAKAAKARAHKPAKAAQPSQAEAEATSTQPSTSLHMLPSLKAAYDTSIEAWLYFSLRMLAHDRLGTLEGSLAALAEYQAAQAAAKQAQAAKLQAYNIKAEAHKAACAAKLPRAQQPAQPAITKETWQADKQAKAAAAAQYAKPSKARRDRKAANKAALAGIKHVQVLRLGDLAIPAKLFFKNIDTLYPLLPIGEYTFSLGSQAEAEAVLTRHDVVYLSADLGIPSSSVRYAYQGATEKHSIAYLTVLPAKPAQAEAHKAAAKAEKAAQAAKAEKAAMRYLFRLYRSKPKVLQSRAQAAKAAAKAAQAAAKAAEGTAEAEAAHKAAQQAAKAAQAAEHAAQPAVFQKAIKAEKAAAKAGLAAFFAMLEGTEYAAAQAAARAQARAHKAQAKARAQAQQPAQAAAKPKARALDLEDFKAIAAKAEKRYILQLTAGQAAKPTKHLSEKQLQVIKACAGFSNFGCYPLGTHKHMQPVHMADTSTGTSTAKQAKAAQQAAKAADTAKAEKAAQADNHIRANMVLTAAQHRVSYFRLLAMVKRTKQATQGRLQRILEHAQAYNALEGISEALSTQWTLKSLQEYAIGKR